MTSMAAQRQAQDLLKNAKKAVKQAHELLTPDDPRCPAEIGVVVGDLEELTHQIEFLVGML